MRSIHPTLCGICLGFISFTALSSLFRENLPNFKLTERIHGSTPSLSLPSSFITSFFRASCSERQKQGYFPPTRVLAREFPRLSAAKTSVNKCYVGDLQLAHAVGLGKLMRTSQNAIKRPTPRRRLASLKNPGIWFCN